MRLPLCAQKRASMNAQDKLIARAPRPVSDRGRGAGATGAISFSQAVHSVASPGISRIPARAIPKRARRVALQPSAKAIRILTDASSRKSMLSANSETEPVAAATANSTPK